jgi:hypothetical protein
LQISRSTLREKIKKFNIEFLNSNQKESSL